MQLTVKDVPRPIREDARSGLLSRSGARRSRDSGAVARMLDASEFLRNLQGSVRDLTEALLQILSGVTPYIPRIHKREDGASVAVTAFLPGVDEASLEISFEGQLLKIRGAKSEQHERIRRNNRTVEKVYRTFERIIPIQARVTKDEAVATFRKEILRVHVPKADSELEVVTPRREFLADGDGVVTSATRRALG